MKATRVLAVAAASALLFAGGTVTASAAPAPTKPVASVDLSRYLGQWYQVAAIPQWFSLQCAKDSTATYTANADGTVGVRNACTTYWGSSSVVTGKAKVQNAPANSELAVSFFKLFGQQIYTGTNYQVIGLGAAYDWAVITDPARSSAFVISRTPAITSAQKATVQSVLSANAIDPCRLQVTPITGGETKAATFC
ncbi:lipocalin family protein [Branchiibius sp. NY16-3462-2]|uniref:lipocalin family protein n=1 Tax=Branchiibius sp. NY16-3462-2 TaxID=1807500 RepID=UPI00079A3674|nr:lipocalin family protein [Branchiibius sp. NY16-3462-2]KYH44986.1 hypothetical protein AZH51_13905 [Branchiibius sp. NY16-3462-2]